MPTESKDGNVEISTITDDGNLCGEGPLWDGGSQSLYWTDAADRKLFRYDWHTLRRSTVLEGFEVNSFSLDESGGLVLANQGGVWFWNKKQFPIQVASEICGRKLRLNDSIADPSGRLLAGSNFYDPSDKYEHGCLFSIGPNGTIEILDEGFHLANGLGFSPDQRTLYFSDSVARTIYSYDYEVVTGQARGRRTFVKLDLNAGVPDGLTVDAEGFVWSAEWYGSCISRYDPDGHLERRISIPAKQTSCLAFGGPDLTDIFVTSAAQSEAMPVMPAGYDPNAGYFGGALFHLNLGITGRLEYKTRFCACER